jgi:quinoprotein glucose dehydrogenase
MTRDEIPDLVPGMKDHCTRFWDENNTLSGDLYSLPLTDRALVRYPASTGGPNWGGGSYNPQTGYYFINTQNAVRYSPPSPTGDGHMTGRTQRQPNPRREVGPEAPTSRRGGGGDEGGGGGQAAGFNFRTPEGVTLSCGATPWGELVAVDVPNKRIAWRVPLGRTESLGALGDQTGTRNLGGNITTASGLVFIGASNDRRFRAFDAKTGQKLWETELEASAHSTPISFMGQDGKQYIVVAAAGGTSAGSATMSDTLVAFRLP